MEAVYSPFHPALQVCLCKGPALLRLILVVLQAMHVVLLELQSRPRNVVFFRIGGMWGRKVHLEADYWLPVCTLQNGPKEIRPCQEVLADTLLRHRRRRPRSSLALIAVLTPTLISCTLVIWLLKKPLQRAILIEGNFEYLQLSSLFCILSGSYLALCFHPKYVGHMNQVHAGA